MTAAVVVVAYKRPRSLDRLMASLLRAEYPAGEEVPLVISIDCDGGEGWQEVCKLARRFEWPFGAKQVIEHEEHLGLIEHLQRCGRLSEQYGDVIILEDDLLVAPPFYRFATAALEAYRDDERVAGTCLYALWFNGFTREPFLPVDDGNDVFFLKLPYTQGLAFTAKQWQRLDAAFAAGRPPPHPDSHPDFQRFGNDEWFPSVARHLVAEERYFCFPRVSLTLGSGDEGTHFGSSTAWLQTPLQLAGRTYRLPPLDDSFAVYDSFYEMLPDRLRRLAPTLPSEAFDVDLNATKAPASLHEGLVITTRPVRRALATFALEMVPPELNLAQPRPEGEISLARRQHMLMDGWAETEARRRLHAYAWRRHRPSRRRSLRFLVARLRQLLRRSQPSGPEHESDAGHHS